jgi:hypothetical protein
LRELKRIVPLITADNRPAHSAFAVTHMVRCVRPTPVASPSERSEATGSDEGSSKFNRLLRVCHWNGAI